jgi:hypothetical protein
LQLEGVWRRGLFRSSKAYYLSGRCGEDPEKEEEEEALLRMRSIPRKLTKQLLPRHFGQDPATNCVAARGVEMRPTLGLEMVMLRQSRTMSHALNLKRRMTASLRACALSGHF